MFCLLDGIEICRSNISMLLILNRNSIGLHMKFSQLATESVSITFAMPVGSTNWLITLDNKHIYYILMQDAVVCCISYFEQVVHKRICVSQIRYDFNVRHFTFCSDFPFPPSCEARISIFLFFSLFFFCWI